MVIVAVVVVVVSILWSQTSCAIKIIWKDSFFYSFYLFSALSIYEPTSVYNIQTYTIPLDNIKLLSHLLIVNNIIFLRDHTYLFRFCTHPILFRLFLIESNENRIFKKYLVIYWTKPTKNSWYIFKQLIYKIESINNLMRHINYHIFFLLQKKNLLLCKKEEIITLLFCKIYVYHTFIDNKIAHHSIRFGSMKV